MIYRSLLTLPILLFLISCTKPAPTSPPAGYAGSASCKECHERFHQLWETSRHRQTIRAYSDTFAGQELTPQTKEIVIGASRYLADISPGVGTMRESGPDGVKTYRMEQVLGGKRLYSFLTTLPDGRIEALPLAYDITRKEWYEAENSSDCPLPPGVAAPGLSDWTQRPVIFTDACPSCHVSQFDLRFEATNKSYAAAWREPGINCETCHGPAAEHNYAMRLIPKGEPVTDTRIISTKRMTIAQRNDLCTVCHAKKTALTGAYFPGERFFDHYDLTALENRDFYPDGRDHGENYTLTGWRMNPCAKTGKIDCMHCHTSSGRYRFKEEAKANDACLPCHAERVAAAAAHSHHPAGSVGSRCVSCHMPSTFFARMKRSDHSLRPPTPAATLAFGSPNSCNICHQDRDPLWADQQVRAWFGDDSQNDALRQAMLVAAARERDWRELPAMLDYIRDEGNDEIYTLSLIRLLRRCDDPSVAETLLVAMKNRSPLVRAAAAEGLGSRPGAAKLAPLLIAAKDDHRLVRIRAAAGLSDYPPEMLPEAGRDQATRAMAEYRNFMLLTPDRSETYATLGRQALQRNEFPTAVEAYKAALTIEPRNAGIMADLSQAQFRSGSRDAAIESLATAIVIDPDNQTAAAMTRKTAYGRDALTLAEERFRDQLTKEPKSAAAAYGLCTIAARDRLAEAIKWCRQAVEYSPDNPRYVMALDEILKEAGLTKEKEVGQ